MWKNKVTISGVNTMDIPILDNDKSKELLEKYQNGDDSVFEYLLYGNLRLVFKALKKCSYYDYYSGRAVDNMYDIEDFFQIGFIGLIEAVKRFDLSMKTSFSTFAIYVILRTISKEFQYSNYRKMCDTQSLKDKINNGKKDFSNTYGRTPTTKELSEAIGESEIRLIRASEAIVMVNSVDEKVSDDGEQFILDGIVDYHSSVDEYLVEKGIEAILGCLTEKEKNVVMNLFYGFSQEEIALEQHVTQKAISRTKKRAMKRIKRFNQKEEIYL